MNTTHTFLSPPIGAAEGDAKRVAATPADRFGGRIAARLEAGAVELPHDLSERLRAARFRAVAARKLPAIVHVHAPEVASQSVVTGPGATPTLGGFGGWWPRLASAVPVVVLLVGMVGVHMVQNERRAREVAEVDMQLLTDDLPPAAYADPAFVQFLKSNR